MRRTSAAAAGAAATGITLWRCREPLWGKSLIFCTSIDSTPQTRQKGELSSYKTKQRPLLLQEFMSGVDSPSRGAARPSANLALADFTLDSAARCVSAKSRQLDISEKIRSDCGEDAFFIANPTKTLAAIGIADGVSSWKSMGIDSAYFAWGLMNGCKDAAEQQELNCPRSLLTTGFGKLASSENPPCGSSTACVASIGCQDGLLKIANLGDSGALLIRSSEQESTESVGVLQTKKKRVVRRCVCLLETEDQAHSFNCPYQLMILPTDEGFTFDEGDLPSDCKEYLAKTSEGDLLILGTDGFFDNVWHHVVLRVASRMRSASASEIANVLISIAHKNSVSEHESTPFGKKAIAAGHRWVGGKADDITIIVARIQRAKSDQ